MHDLVASGQRVSVHFYGKRTTGQVAADPHALARFQREAQAISAPNHPNICTIHDIGEQDDGHALSWRDVNRVLFIAAAGGPAPQKFLSRARQNPNSH
jgi:hypothetical protein